MRRALLAACLLCTAACDGGSCDAVAECAASYAWSAKACDCVPVLAREAGNFWQYFEADYEWVEYHPTLKDAVASSDAALLGKLSAVKRGVVIQGDSKEDVYAEVDITVEVLDPLHGDARSTSSLQLTLIPNRGVSDELLSQLTRALPSEPALLILRKREAGTYRVVNGFGLWTRTPRAALDAPLEARADLDFVAAELAGKDTVQDLAASLR